VQLQAEVVKSARTEAERVRIAAEAQADATRLAAEAAASSNCIALHQAMIAQLLELVRAAAQGLQGANLTALNGAEGLSETVASMAAQGAAVLRTVLQGLGERGGASGGRATGNGHPTTPTDRVQVGG
jgi:flotillin